MSQINLKSERPIPRTRDQAKRIFSNDKIKNLTKIKLQEYIESFFNKGTNFDLLRAVSPRFINYNTSKSFDPKTDPTQRRLQVARYFNELHAIVPSILVVDGGINSMPDTIGSVSDVYMTPEYWRGYYPIVKKIPIMILAAARDVDEADEMSGIISLMFNEMRNLAGGQYITGDQDAGETWVVTLPNEPVNVGALTSTDVNGDQVEKIWYTEATFEVMFEDVLGVKIDMPKYEMKGAIISDPDPSLTKAPVIHVPSQVPINTQPVVFIENLQTGYRVILSSASVATISHTMRLTPRTRGKFFIQVIDPQQDHNGGKYIRAQKEVEII